MQQYLYANIQHQSYKLVSSAPEFFGNVHNAKVMRHLISHDNHVVHGTLPPLEHQSYWMVTTDMDRPGETPKLFLQASGGDPHRDGIYVQGYLCEARDLSLYKNNMRELLSLPFLDLEGTLQYGEQGLLPQVELSSLKLKTELVPVKMKHECLKAILLSILQRKKVIIRIPYTGREAMQYSRELLLTIYEHLPYGYRASTGFVTGLTLSAMNNENNPLPGAVNLILLDADADIFGYHPRPGQSLFDLTDPASIEPVPMEKDGNPLPYAGLLSYLTDREGEDLRRLYDSMLEYKQNEKPNTRMELPDYLMAYSIFNKMSGTLTEQSVKRWAADLLINRQWNPRTRNSFCQGISEKISPERLLEHLLSQLTCSSQAETLGVLDTNELGQIALDKTGAVEIRDANAGMVLRMTEKLLEFYPEGTRELLTGGLIRYLESLAEQEHPELAELQPTVKTVHCLQGWNLTAKSESTVLGDAVRREVLSRIDRRKKETENTYHKNLREQADAGIQRIRNWFTVRQGTSLESLYQDLQAQSYLWEELMESWNPEIGRLLVIQYTQPNSDPVTLDQVRFFPGAMEQDMACFQDHRGKLPENQKAAWKARADWCRRTLDRADSPCTDLPELLQLMNEVDGEKQRAELTGQMKDIWVRNLLNAGASRESVLENCQAVCETAENASNHALLKCVLAQAPELRTIGRGLPVRKAVDLLRKLDQLERSGLLSGQIRFEDWNSENTAQYYLSRISTISGYRWGKPMPDLRDGSVQQWVLQQFPELQDLCIVLARQAKDLRPEMLRRLAASQQGTAEILRYLYEHGCSRAELTAGAGEQTAQRWRDAAAEVFPAPVKLPEPEALPPLRRQDKNGFILTESILLGLGALAAGITVLAGHGTLLQCGAAAGVLGFLALLLESVSLLVSGRNQKKMMRWMGAAMVPGVMTAAAAVILAIL